MTQRQAIQRRRPRRRHADSEAETPLAAHGGQLTAAEALRQVQTQPTTGAIQTLQRTVGNAVTQRVLAGSGMLLQREEADPDAAGGAPPPSKMGYLGFNPDASHEAKALKGRMKDNVIIALNDPAVEASLATEEGIAKWVDAHLITDFWDQLDLFVAATETLEKTSPASRDMMAQAMLMFAAAERGDYTLERLVLSGHSNGVELWGDDAAGHNAGKFIVDKDLVRLAETFPGAAAQVQDIMFSACYSANSITLVAKVFPNLQNAWGYLGFSPTAKGGAVTHLNKFEKETRGDQGLDAKDGLGKAALWTRDAADAGGTGFIRNDIADMDVDKLWDAHAQYDEDYKAEFAGDKPIGREMTVFYSLVQYLLMHPQVDNTDRKMLEEQREILLRMRYWDRVTTRFAGDYKEQITKAYGAIGRGIPAFAGMSRGKVKEEMAAFAAKLADTPDAGAQAFLDKYLTALWTLTDLDVIPSTWI